MKYIKYLLLLGVIVYLYHLKTRDHEEPFEVTESGLHYRITQEGTPAEIQDQEVLLIRVRYEYKDGRQVFIAVDQVLPQTAFVQRTKVDQESNKGDFEEAWGLLRRTGLGGKITFKMVLEKFPRSVIKQLMTHFEIPSSTESNMEEISKYFKVPSDTCVHISAELEKIMTREQYESQREDLYKQQMKEQAAAKEAHLDPQMQKDLAIIQKYLQDNHLQAQRTGSGLHYIITVPGQGAPVKKGDQVHVDFIACRLDKSRPFQTNIELVAKEHRLYSTVHSYGPLKFRLGTGTMVAGCEEALGLFREGCKARLFLPSALGFGEKGTLVYVPPNTVLIYDVTLIKREREQK